MGTDAYKKACDVLEQSIKITAPPVIGMQPAWDREDDFWFIMDIIFIH